jgi:thiol-disulfide isomerase/thioredoxin
MSGKKHLVVDVTEGSYVKVACCVMKLSASWCSPCKVAKPWFSEKAKEYKSCIDCYEVDVEDYPEGIHPLFDKLTSSVKSLPTWHFIFDGEVKKTLTGFGDPHSRTKEKLDLEFKLLAKLQGERPAFVQPELEDSPLPEYDDLTPSDASVTLAALHEDFIFDEVSATNLHSGTKDEVGTMRNLSEFVKKTALYFSKEENTKRRRDLPSNYDEDDEGETLHYEDGCIEPMDISSNIHGIIASMGSFKDDRPGKEVLEV